MMNIFDLLGLVPGHQRLQTSWHCDGTGVGRRADTRHLGGIGPADPRGQGLR